MSRRLLFLCLLLLSALLVAGCSYQPARIKSEPLVIFEEDRGYHDHDRGPGRGFCPPGLRKQGRC
ncbi:hypothetical protein [Halomonas sp. NO4]|uniref:hypothetical protein n=1 Tax=Halomonas sp. NO4 TaxID=2484813 RepID=UPI0013D0C1D1|nr:hypothetical protein [Halomonas sp. NO4]